MKNGHDWLEFIQGQMFFSLFCGALFGLVLLGAELLHVVSGGRTPSLIERLAESEPVPRYKINPEEEINDEEEDDFIHHWNP